MIDEKLLKPYDPQATESRVYEKWEKSGFFAPEKQANWAQDPKSNPNFGKNFTIMMPPPNVTGSLHMGHALGLTIQDIAIRFERMRGKKTLWLPGTDHAAIATQSKVEKDIKKKENKSRHELGREELLKRIEDFAIQSHDNIQAQIKVFGASCDWSREAFTLDKKRNQAVVHMFKKMYEDKLIYRGDRIVNWDTKGQTTISDDEIVYENQKTKLYTFKYSADFPIAISTTRPETKVGDTAVAVHPEDVRYKKYVGQSFEIKDFCGVSLNIKIIADTTVEPEFGTGALGVTPSHSQIDWEIAERHKLDIKPVINEQARMTVGGENLLGKKTLEAREIIITWLLAQGLLEKEEETEHNVATAERTGGIIEPLPKLQYFIDVNKPIPHLKDPGSPSSGKTLKELMREPVEKGEIKIIPEHFTKTYFHWIENLRDWCISRQIWYGHRIPVWYHEPKCVPIPGREADISKCPEIVVGEEKSKCEFCNAMYIQDPDTLDTWFSSGLWSFSTLGWPEKTEDLKNFHPTSLIVPGYEILFFWIARMILMSEYALDEIPFKQIYLTGIVRDSQGRKFSKSLGNGIDPIEIAKKFGADAGRMSMIIGNTPGTDMKLSEDKIKAYKHFANKLWNVSRFILENSSETESKVEPCCPTNQGLTLIENPIEQKLIEEFNNLAKDITYDLENYRYYLAGEKIYHYVWDRLASEIIEESKIIFKGPAAEGGGAEAIQARKITLLYLLENSLKILHPFMPFVTEEIWSILLKSVSGDNRLLIVAKWPVL
jgi:valyl-tRNA synthetase